MKRRRFLAGTAAIALAAPAVPAAGDPKLLQFIPQADIALLDQTFAPALATRNHAYMVYDMLYGVDDALRPRPQMTAGHVIEEARSGRSRCATACASMAARRCWRAMPSLRSSAGRSATSMRSPYSRRWTSFRPSPITCCSSASFADLLGKPKPVRTCGHAGAPGGDRAVYTAWRVLPCVGVSAGPEGQRADVHQSASGIGRA